MKNLISTSCQILVADVQVGLVYTAQAKVFPG